MQNRIDMGLALLEMQSWHKVSVGSGFMVLSNKKELEKTVRCPIDSNFMEILDKSSQKGLTEMAAGTGSEDIGSSILFTPQGTPLELLLVNREGKIEIFLRNIEDRLRSLEHLTIFFRHFLTTPIAICFTDKEAVIINANKAFLDLYGYRLDEIIGKKPSILKSGRQSPAAYRDLWASISEPSGGNWCGEIINRRKNGEERTVHLTVSAVRKNNGGIIGFVASTFDISREKRLEEALQARNEELLELTDLKSDLMAMTSHELIAPLNLVISRASLIKGAINVVPPEDLMVQLDLIISDCSRMVHFVNDNMDSEEAESGTLKLSTTRVRLDAILKSCIDMTSASAMKKQLTVSLDIQAASEPVLADPVKLEQVFTSLISHAVEFSPAGSEIFIVYRNCAEGKLVQVFDKGPPLAEEDVVAIFDRYFHVRKKGPPPARGFGIGTGLHCARKIVELHGGKIETENIPTGGCVFSVRIPADLPVVSGRDMAAVIHDPSGSVFHYLEGPLRAHNVSCFITRTLFEAERVFTYEKPNLVFIEQSSFTAELRDLFGAVVESAGVESRFILVAHQKPSIEDGFFSRVLLAPVSYRAVADILKEVRVKPPPSIDSRSVLIMDYEEATDEILEESLRLAGYRTTHTYGSIDDRKIMATDIPDLILLDVHTPEEAEGFRILERLKSNAELRHVPVILLTSPDHSTLNEKALELGAEDYITKPFNRIELLARVKATIRRSAMQRKVEGTLEGNLADVTLPELLQTLEIGRKSGRVNLKEMDGEIYVTEGMYVSARQGAFYGKEAFTRLFYLEKGSFAVQFGPCHLEFAEPALAVQSLLMATAAYIDEVRFLLASLPPEGTVMDLTEGMESCAELAGLRSFLPCSLQDLLVLMKGSLKQNAESVVTAYGESKLKAA